jgi:hypothetical protein
MRLTQGVGGPLALEAVGGEVTLKSMRCLAPFGCLVNYGKASNQPASLRLASFREQRAAMGFSLPAMPPRADNQAAMAEILDFILAGKVRLSVDQVLPLSEAAKAHVHLSNRGTLDNGEHLTRLGSNHRRLKLKLGWRETAWSSSRALTPAFSCCRKPERRRSEGCRQSAARRC